jgi:histidine triad (HIT) family protein
MNKHAPKNYICPICLGNRGTENENTYLKQDDCVFRDELVRVYINSFWIGKNEGHLIVVPNEHYESIYGLQQDVGHRIFDVAQKMCSA